jgi:hypothetical protein
MKEAKSEFLKLHENQDYEDKIGIGIIWNIMKNDSNFMLKIGK